MRYSLFVVFLFVTVLGFSQKKAKYTIYKMGRPDSFERNNAVKDVQRKWKLNFEYVSGSGVYSEKLDSIDNENTTTNKALVAKYGEDWRSVIMKQVGERLAQHNECRKLLAVQYDSLINAVKNVMIEVELVNKRKAKFKVFGMEVIEGKVQYLTYFKFKLNRKKSKFKLISNEKELIDFSYPENDIINR